MSLAKHKRPSREDKMIRTEKRLESDVFDRQSLMAISKLRQQGHFETVDYPVAKGKEANIFRICATLTSKIWADNEIEKIQKSMNNSGGA